MLRLANEEEEDDFKVPESIKDANEVSGMSDFFSPLAFMIVVFVTPRNCDFAVAFRLVLCTFCKPFWRSIAAVQERNYLHQQDSHLSESKSANLHQNDSDMVKVMEICKLL